MTTWRTVVVDVVTEHCVKKSWGRQSFAENGQIVSETCFVLPFFLCILAGPWSRPCTNRREFMHIMHRLSVIWFNFRLMRTLPTARFPPHLWWLILLLKRSHWIMSDGKTHKGKWWKVHTTTMTTTTTTTTVAVGPHRDNSLWKAIVFSSMRVYVLWSPTLEPFQSYAQPLLGARVSTEWMVPSVHSFIHESNGYNCWWWILNRRARERSHLRPRYSNEHHDDMETMPQTRREEWEDIYRLSPIVSLQEQWQKLWFVFSILPILRYWIFIISLASRASERSNCDIWTEFDSELSHSSTSHPSDADRTFTNFVINFGIYSIDTNDNCIPLQSTLYTNQWIYEYSFDETIAHTHNLHTQNMLYIKQIIPKSSRFDLFKSSRITDS